MVYDNSTGPDTTAPKIVGELPPSGAQGVPPATNVVVGFDEPMTASTITTSTVQLRDPAGNLVPASVSYDASSLSATLDPTGDLADSTTYTVRVQGGTGGVADRAGNTLAADRTWSFATASPPGPPPDEGAGGPILVIGKASNPFTRYYAEILRGEGLTQFTVKDVSTVTAATLASYDVAVLGEMSLTSAQASMLSTWVNGGGDLVAMRPDKQLAGLLGLTDAGTTLANAYLQGRHGERARPRDRQPDDAVPRHRGPLRAERRDERRRPLLERVDGDDGAGRDHAQRRQLRRPRGGVHLRPRQVGRLHAPGQPAVGRPGARRHVAGPLRRHVLRQRAVRPAAELGRSQQGRDPAGRRAAAPAGEPARHADRRQEADPALLVPAEGPQGRGDHDRRRPRQRRHRRALRPVPRRERGRLLGRAVGVHPRDVVRLLGLPAHERPGRHRDLRGLRGGPARHHRLRRLHAGVARGRLLVAAARVGWPLSRASPPRCRSGRTASPTATGRRRRRPTSRTACGSTPTTTTGRPSGSATSPASSPARACRCGSPTPTAR